MDHDLINIILALIFAGIGAAAKKKSAGQKGKAADAATPTPSTAASDTTLTDADRRYREVQEEIRRRIAQRNQNTPSQPTAATSSPRQDYQPSAQSTAPIKPLAKARRQKAAPPPRLVASSRTVVVKSVMADAPPPEAAPAYPSEATAYALPQDSGDNAASSNSSPGGSNALRAILASPSAARQAFLLREIFATPLGLRPMASGGLDDWN